MRLGFVILSHQKPGPNFIKLLEFINGIEGASIALHHDFSQSDFPADIIKKYNIRLVTPQRITKWCGMPNVFATLDGLLMLLALEEPPDWFLTLSANCYPIKSRETILSFFKETTYETFIERNQIIKEKGGIYEIHHRTIFTKYLASIPFMSRRGKFYFRPLRLKVKPEQTPFYGGYLPYTGSDWLALDRKAVVMIQDADLYNHPLVTFLNKINASPDRLCCPAEVVLQTFFGNDTKLRHANRNLHYIDWENARDWHPATLGMGHVEAITKTDALFARKFSTRPDDELLNHVDKSLLR